jgi:hypothetical protein
MAEFLKVEVVREHIDRAAKDVGYYAAADFKSTMEARLAGSDDDQPEHFKLRLESPLEAIFYIWWEAMCGGENYFGRVFYLDRQVPVTVDGASYRLDFVIDLGPYGQEQVGGLEWARLAVEVDGHSFHEKTPEQVASRNMRDRALQQAGWMVQHFSWTEMTTRPEMCIGEVFGVARGKFEELRRQHWAAKRAATVDATND